MDIYKAEVDIKDFLLKAGQEALVMQSGIKCDYKAGQQAVTEADLYVSKMAKEYLSDWLSKDGHVLVDEEYITSTPEEVFSSSEYQWVLDPIDGTAGYALGRRMWGVSLGLLHNGKVVAGGFYMPAIGELLITDQYKAVCINTSTEENHVLEAINMEVNSQVYVESFIGFEHHWKTDITKNKVWLNTPECGVQGFYSAFTNQAAAASFFPAFSAWDIAGACAIATKTGHRILSLDDGAEWSGFSAEVLKDNWKVKGEWLIVHPDNYEYIRDAIKGS